MGDIPKQLSPYAFKPGQSGNPSGRPKSVLTTNDIEVLAQNFLLKTVGELNHIQVSPMSPIIERIVARTLIAAAERSDFDHANGVIERAIGKVVQKIEQDSRSTHLNLSMLSDEQLLALSREAIKVIEKDARPTLPEASTEK